MEALSTEDRSVGVVGCFPGKNVTGEFSRILKTTFVDLHLVSFFSTRFPLPEPHLSSQTTAYCSSFNENASESYRYVNVLRVGDHHLYRRLRDPPIRLVGGLWQDRRDHK